MAILGLILGLGFMIPLSTNELRIPASARSTIHSPKEFLFIESKQKVDVHPSGSTTPPPKNGVDPRKDVLFDIHTVSKSGYAKNTDAYVLTHFVDEARTEIERFADCHNYDFRQQKALTHLSRYSLDHDGFNCYEISLPWIAKGETIITSILGPILALKTGAGFDSKKGGIISIIFAYKIAKIGSNDYRALDIRLSLVDGVLKILGPNGKTFDWLNINVNSDFFNFPSGVDSFEFYDHGKKISFLDGNSFRKVSSPEN